MRSDDATSGRANPGQFYCRAISHHGGVNANHATTRYPPARLRRNAAVAAVIEKTSNCSVRAIQHAGGRRAPSLVAGTFQADFNCLKVSHTPVGSTLQRFAEISDSAISAVP